MCTLDWVGRGRGAARVPARGVVTVPDGVEISLDVMVTGSRKPADLSFLRQLPADSITDLQLDAPIRPESVAAVTHLAPGLRRLYLAWADLTDDALTHVSKLYGLTYLQSWGNRFTDRGVQDVPFTGVELAELRRRLPGVDIG